MTHSTPLTVSVIIDNYNYAQFLAAAIESALGQSYPYCEVIVVDDGSTDGSREILQRYGSRIKPLLKANGGQSSALNSGFQLASGDLIAFLDSDDSLFPTAIETAVSHWREGIAKVQFPLEVLDQHANGTGLLMPRNPLSHGRLLDSYLQSGRYIASPTSGNLFSRRFLEQILPIPEQEWAQTADGYINTCVPFFGEVAAIQKPLGFYRIHGKSMSSVCSEGVADLEQIKKLIQHAMLEKSLLERLAGERGLKLPRGVVVSHWMHLKLRIAFHKLAEPVWLEKIKPLLSSGIAMIASVAKAPELSAIRKLQNIAWAIGVLTLPTANARWLIRCAFDKSPVSRLSRMLRRA